MQFYSFKLALFQKFIHNALLKTLNIFRKNIKFNHYSAIILKKKTVLITNQVIYVKLKPRIHSVSETN